MTGPALFLPVTVITTVCPPTSMFPPATSRHWTETGVGRFRLPRPGTDAALSDGLTVLAAASVMLLLVAERAPAEKRRV